MIRNKREEIVSKGLLIVVLILTIIPFVSMLSAALQPANSTPVGLMFPSHPQWHNFVTAFDGGHVGVLMQSSVLIVLGVLPITVICATLGGYALGRLRVRGGFFIFILFLLGLTIPFESLIVPLYYEIDSLNLLNSQKALIFPLIGLFMPFSVIWMRAHFMQVPQEISEAAEVDGASRIQEFFKVQLPLAANALSALGILIFLWTWNQFILGLVLIDDPLKRTVAGSLTYFQGQYWISIPLLDAGALIIITPAVAIFLIFHKRFISALLQGAVKG